MDNTARQRWKTTVCDSMGTGQRNDRGTTEQRKTKTEKAKCFVRFVIYIGNVVKCNIVTTEELLPVT